MSGHFADLPDGYITLEVRRADDGDAWEVNDSDDGTDVVGKAASPTRAVEDYGRQIAERFDGVDPALLEQ